MASITADLDELARFGSGGAGVTRLAWSPELAAASEWLLARLRALELLVGAGA